MLTVSDRFAEYATSVRDELSGEDTRIELDDRSESIGRKIREAELRKIPYMLIVGIARRPPGGVVREHHGGDTGSMPIAAFAERLAGELYSTTLKPGNSSQSHA